ncbi:putative metallo-beta-lactamase domain protein [Triangularia verruculosa]|uniref:Metallo-beta-lactamase domain protein n=1 Tax=Triangularia verruculosa TaxID=2587418 RepID=A0AAN6X8K9_9PEZI|nr:putative metallo-beta-lactamase domain protein [Triangularia verruculosa]
MSRREGWGSFEVGWRPSSGTTRCQDTIRISLGTAQLQIMVELIFHLQVTTGITFGVLVMRLLPPFLHQHFHHHHRQPNHTLRKMAQLPPLPEVTPLTPSITRILAGNPSRFTLQGTNTYLVGSGPNNRILIDTGEGKPSWIAALKSFLSNSSATISKCIITHWHGDHVGGIPDLLSAFPNVKLYKHRPDYHNPSNFPFLDIADGQEFEVGGGGRLKAVWTPGHTEDHMVLQYFPPSSSLPSSSQSELFTGDNVLGHGTAVFEDLASYLTSLSKMKILATGKAYPGHGPVIEQARDKIDEYIRHRKQREDQVVQQLRQYPEITAVGSEKGWTLMGLVRVIYKDVPEALHLPAAGGVVQILKKLEREGRVRVVAEGDGGMGEEDSPSGWRGKGEVFLDRKRDA